MRRLIGMLAATFCVVHLMTADTKAASPENEVYMELETGRVTIELRPDIAPNHVKRFKELIRQGFYDGLTFHRVIDGFMAQTGDPRGDGTGGSGQKIKAEFNDMEQFYRGTVGMARGGDPDSADSQFFICFERAQWLDGKYTIIGEVIDGMENVMAIKRGDSRSGAVNGPDKIVSMKMAADAK
jgi:peptidylprolyl isomerase